jgi:hypothetical protein
MNFTATSLWTLSVFVLKVHILVVLKPQNNNYIPEVLTCLIIKIY